MEVVTFCGFTPSCLGLDHSVNGAAALEHLPYEEHHHIIQSRSSRLLVNHNTGQKSFQILYIPGLRPARLARCDPYKGQQTLEVGHSSLYSMTCNLLRFEFNGLQMNSSIGAPNQVFSGIIENRLQWRDLTCATLAYALIEQPRERSTQSFVLISTLRVTDAGYLQEDIRPCFLRYHHQAPRTRPMTTTGTITPIAIFAPVERPPPPSSQG
jgi:hypothetical protein